jgi:glucose/arabinose dehydrogenase
MRLIILGFVFLTAAFRASAAIELDKIKLPPGFEISVFASDVTGARGMALSPDNVLYVGTHDLGAVWAIPVANGNKPGKPRVIAKGLTFPVGVAYHDGYLYVSSLNEIVRYPDMDKFIDKDIQPAGQVVIKTFPTEKHHGWKFIAFGPDGLLYVPVGAPCNICEPNPDRYANIMRMKADGSGLEVFARGVRNTVGFDWNPRTKEMWFTDNGRDMLGDDMPSDELNHAPKPGMNFGFPYCHQGDTPDPEFGGAKHPCSMFTPPVLKLGPHVAALGMRFYTGKMFPAAYKDSIFIAEHGSWNRSHKIGYRVMRVVLKGDKVVKYEVFAEGWQQGERNWGRPVDVQQLPDGSLLVSDDAASAIYRIAYAGKKK